MAKVVRYGDQTIGECLECKHSRVGMIISSSSDVKANVKGNARIGDIVQASCGHIGYIVSGSSLTQVNSKKTALVNGVFDGVYRGILMTGSDDVNDGG